MADHNILNAKDFTFAPYNPSVGTDSGKLLMATAKGDAQVRYVVKAASPELACNEFMYHKVAAALGLHTLEVKLFEGVAGSRDAAGIRFSPSARLFDCRTATAENFRDFCAFHTLYVILNEEDSQEFYIDERERVFKLDNAASFNFTPTISMPALANAGKNAGKLNPVLKEMLHRCLNHVEYTKYKFICEILVEKFGSESEDACLSLFDRFAAFDDSVLDEAYRSLNMVYPEWLSEYYCEFILIRQAACKKYLRDLRS
jgi:hypothetical protein